MTCPMARAFSPAPTAAGWKDFSRTANICESVHAVQSASGPVPVSLEQKPAAPPVKLSALAGLSGKKLMAVDGATLNLVAIEGGIERDITDAGGAAEKDHFHLHQ